MAQLLAIRLTWPSGDAVLRPGEERPFWFFDGRGLPSRTVPPQVTTGTETLPGEAAGLHAKVRT